MKKINLLIFGLVLFTGCFRGAAKSDADKTDAGKEAQPVGITDLDKEFAAMKPVDPVKHDKLLPILPKGPAGFEGDEPRGETISIFGQGVAAKHSFVKQTFRNNEKTVRVQILDAAHIRQLYAGVENTWKMNINFETSNGHQKTVTIDGNPGFESWQKGNKRTELVIMVAKRYLVTVTTEGTPPDLARTVFDSIDIEKLSALK